MATVSALLLAIVLVATGDLVMWATLHRFFDFPSYCLGVLVAVAVQWRLALHKSTKDG